MPYSYQVLGITPTTETHEWTETIDKFEPLTGTGDPNGVEYSFVTRRLYFDSVAEELWICSFSDGSGTPGGTTWILVNSGGGGGSSNAKTSGNVIETVPGFVAKKRNAILQAAPFPYLIRPSGTLSTYNCPASDTPTSIVSAHTVTASNALFTANPGTNSIRAYRLDGVPFLPAQTIPTGSAGVENICAGPDFDIWFTETSQNKIGKLDTTFTFTEYILPTLASQPQGIATGPDERLWGCSFAVDKIFASTTSGTISEYPLPTATDPTQICAHSDGNMWALADSTILKIEMNGTITEYALAFTGSYIASGSDGKLYVTESDNVHAINTDGTVFATYNSLGEDFRGICSGGDGNIYVANFNGAVSASIYKLTTFGLQAATNDLTNNGTVSICAGQDGRIWATGSSSNKILAMPFIVDPTGPFGNSLESSGGTLTIAKNYDTGITDLSVTNSEALDFARRVVYINPIMGATNRTLVGGGTLSDTAPGGTFGVGAEFGIRLMTPFNTGSGSGDYALERETVGTTALELYPIYEVLFGLANNTDIRLWFALTRTSEDPRQNDTPNNTLGLRFSTAASDVNFQLYSKANGGSPTITDSGIVAAASTVYHLKIDFSDGANAFFYLNGTFIDVITTTLPALTDLLTLYASLSTMVFSAKTMYVGRHQCNTY